MLNIIGLNTANYSNCVSWNNITGHITTVGFNGGPSPYNTYDQNGNVWEWLETTSLRDNTVYRTFAGGSYKDSELALRSSYIHDRYYPGATEPNNDVAIYPFVGFRVASYVNPLDLQFFVPVLDADNIANNSIGSVSYNYQISQYQVLISDYVTFLNTVDPNGTLSQTTDTFNSLGEPITDSKNTLYHYLMNNDSRGGIIRNISADIGNKYAMKSNMFGKPINFVNWYMAAAYCNWLHNRVDNINSTEYMTGVYDLNSSSPNNAQRNNNARYFLPTLDEWHKAAYYKGGNSGDLNAGYWLYATRSNQPPSCSYIDSSGVGPWQYTLDYVNIPLTNLNPLDNYTVTLSLEEKNIYDAYLDKYSYSFMASKSTQNVVVGLTKNLLINNLTIVATVTNISSNIVENILYVPMICPNSSCVLDRGSVSDPPPTVPPPDSPPTAATNTSNAANYNNGADWNNQDGNVTTVGSNGGPSYYGTFDQSGNVFQWNDLDGNLIARRISGGGWSNFAFGLSSSNLSYFIPATEMSTLGFRLSSSINPLELPYFVNIEDTNNSNDTINTGINYGRVTYPYQMSRYLVTNFEYAAFLNAVDPEGLNPQGIYNSLMATEPYGGITFTTSNSNSKKYNVKTNMGNKPVNYISWFDAVRYCNWLHNEKPTFSTTAAAASARNNGSYNVGTNATGFSNAVAKNSDAKYYIPTENEWYKAAYYSPNKNGPGLAGYYKYATQSDIDPQPTLANSVGDGLANISNYSTSITLGLFSQWRIRNLTTNATLLTGSILNGIISNLPSDYGPNNTSLSQSIQLQTYLTASDTWISQESWTSRLGNSNNIFRPWNWNLVGGV